MSDDEKKDLDNDKADATEEEPAAEAAAEEAEAAASGDDAAEASGDDAAEASGDDDAADASGDDDAAEASGDDDAADASGDDDAADASGDDAPADASGDDAPAPAAHGHGHGGSQAEKLAAHKARVKKYVKVAIGLAVLTVIEVAIPEWTPLANFLGKTNIITLLILLALAKAGMVGMYYMHLKGETKFMKWTVAFPMIFPALYAFILIAEGIYRAVWGMG